MQHSVRSQSQVTRVLHHRDQCAPLSQFSISIESYRVNFSNNNIHTCIIRSSCSHLYYMKLLIILDQILFSCWSRLTMTLGTLFDDTVLYVTFVKLCGFSSMVPIKRMYYYISRHAHI